MDEDTGTNMDENYEIAMSEDGVYAYKIVGRVMEEGSRQSKAMWKLAAKLLRAHFRHGHADVLSVYSAVLNRFVTLPEDFFPETTLVGIGYNGVYNVYLLNEKDVAMRSFRKGIATAEEAETVGKAALAKAQTPRTQTGSSAKNKSSRPPRRARTNPVRPPAWHDEMTIK